MAYPRFQRARSFKRTTRTAGDIILNSTTWADVDTGLDLVLTAQIGDVIEYGIHGRMSDATPEVYMDVATVVSAAVASYFSSGTITPATLGTPGWLCSASTTVLLTGSVLSFPLAAGDISGGLVTLRLRYYESSAVARAIFASAAQPLHIFAKNLGPVDPN